jgi:hypothetical protein
MQALCGVTAMTELDIPALMVATPHRRCDKCDAAMTHLSDLPAFSTAPPVRIFRCYVCNHVVSEDR